MTLNGTLTASKIYDRLENDISKLNNKPTLGAVLVGENSVSVRYIKQKRKFAQQIGIGFELMQFSENISESELLVEIEKCNTSDDISGYIVQLPLPSHIDSGTIINAISPLKDVDGFHPQNQGKIMIGDESGFTPCTPAGIMHLFQEYNISLPGKKVCIIGRSNIVGKPLALLCINAGATVTSCNSRTPDLKEFTQSADIVVCATGLPHLLTPDMTHKGVIIIDVGFSVVNGKILGDADSEAFIEAGNTITPVPGGVGPMTVAMLMHNTYLAHTRQYEK